MPCSTQFGGMDASPHARIAGGLSARSGTPKDVPDIQLLPNAGARPSLRYTRINNNGVPTKSVGGDGT